MAKDITIAVTGQNPDGTLNVRQVGGDSGNPFQQQSQSMVPYNPTGGIVPSTGGYKARIGNVDVNFASEADFLKADRELREMMPGNGNAPVLGGYRGGGWLRGRRHADVAPHRGRRSQRHWRVSRVARDSAQDRRRAERAR